MRTTPTQGPGQGAAGRAQPTLGGPKGAVWYAQYEALNGAKQVMLDKNMDETISWIIEKEAEISTELVRIWKASRVFWNGNRDSRETQRQSRTKWQRLKRRQVYLNSSPTLRPTDSKRDTRLALATLLDWRPPGKRSYVRTSRSSATSMTTGS